MKCHRGHSFGYRERLIIHCLLLPGRIHWIHTLFVRTGYKKDIWALTAYPSSFVLCSCSFTASQRNHSEILDGIFTVTTHSGLPVIAQ